MPRPSRQRISKEENNIKQVVSSTIHRFASQKIILSADTAVIASSQMYNNIIYRADEQTKILR
jgi:hypothetical protein